MGRVLLLGLAPNPFPDEPRETTEVISPTDPKHIVVSGAVYLQPFPRWASRLRQDFSHLEWNDLIFRPMDNQDRSSHLR